MIDFSKLPRHVRTMKREKIGCFHFDIAYNDDKRWCIVLGYDEEIESCVIKLAYQSYNTLLQCDYDCDWTMPYNAETGEVYDNELVVNENNVILAAKELYELSNEYCLYRKVG